MKMKKIAFVVCMLLSFMAQADDGVYRPTETRDYVVSGVLQKAQDGITIKLVHSVERARNENEAVGSFTAKVLAKYPGYGVLITLTSTLEGGKCDIEI